MASEASVLLPKQTYGDALPGYKIREQTKTADECKISGTKEGTQVCQHTRDCWERATPFVGGSVAWRGDAEGDEAAREAERRCHWSRCPWHSCALFSCSGDFDLETFRPGCRELTVCAPKPRKRAWCYPLEASILHHCDPCPRSPYDCEPEEQQSECAARPLKFIPLFRWEYGIPYPNIRREPYPHLMEGLPWKEQPPTPPPPRRESDVWALGCWRLDDQGEPTYAPCSPPAPCPGQWQPGTPLFTWHNGYPKENFSRLPYPGHGPKPFDPCAARLARRACLAQRRRRPATQAGGAGRAGCHPSAI